jgi:hypothetical protein
LNILKTALMFNFIGDGNWRHNFSGYPALSALTGIFFIVGIVIAFKKIFKRDKDSTMPAFFLFSWIAVSLLPVVMSNEGIPHALRAIIAIPATMVVAAFGADFLWTKFRYYFSSEKRGSLLLKIIAGGAFSFLLIEPFIMYFALWGTSPHVSGAFNANYVKIAREINALPKETKKYVVVMAGGAEVRGIPMPAQTVMFMTNSFTEKGMSENNIRYFKPSDKLPSGNEEAVVFSID